MKAAFVRTVSVATLACAALYSVGSVFAGPLPLPEGQVALDSEEGVRLLFESGMAEKALGLLSVLECQQNTAFCGPATVVTILNASGAAQPEPGAYAPYRYFTQDNVFTDPVESVVRKSTVRRQGMTLRQFAAALRAHAPSATEYSASDSSVQDFLEKAKTVLGTSDGFLAVNYLRSSVGQQGGGHISPVAAVHGDGRVLVLDVSKYKYRPMWIRADELFTAMAAKDGASGRARGFVVVTGDTLRR